MVDGKRNKDKDNAYAFRVKELKKSYEKGRHSEPEITV